MGSSLSKILSQPLDPEDVTAIIAEMDTDGPRGAAILGAVLVEESLRLLLVANMRCTNRATADSLFGPMKPLSSFSAKIDLGFALGHYGDRTKCDLHRVREIRNAFAHARRLIDFSTPEVAQVCDQLNVKSNFPTSNSRDGYIMACKLLATHMLMKHRDLGPILPGYAPLD